ncbi:MAG: hypothetical protein ACTSUC_09320 [Promethearchaeota archaeon]
MQCIIDEEKHIKAIKQLKEEWLKRSTDPFEGEIYAKGISLFT